MNRLLYLTTAVLLLTGMSLFAQSPDFSFEEKLWIESHRVIRVQNEAEWAPFNFNDRGAPMGYSVEYIEILAEMAGLEVEFISGYSWNEYLNMIRGGGLDVMINIVRTPEREEFLSFTEPFIQYSPSIFIREDMEEIRSLEDLYGKRFALQEGYFYKDQISLHPEIEILPVKSTTEAVLAVSRGQADVMIDLMPIVNYLTETLLITNLKPGGAIELENSGITLARIGVRKDWKDLAAILNKCIPLVPEETLEALRAKWLGSGSADSSDRVKLIDEEIGFLREHPLIRVYSPVNRPPFSFGEQPRGLAVDYMDTLARTLKIEIEYIRGPAAEGQKALKEGRADILLLSSGEALPNQAGPYFIDPQVIISRNDKAYQTLESLKGKTVALSPDFPYREVLEREFPEIRIADKADLHESLKAVVFGEADAASGGYAGALYTIRNSFLSDLSLTGELNPGEDSDKELFFGVSGDLPLLASALQKAWDSLSGQERNRIGSQWTGTMTPLNPFEGTRETEENDFPLGRIIIITLLMIAAAVVLQQLIWNRRRINTVLDMKKIRLFSLLFLSISILLILLTASVGLIYVRSSMKEDAERNLQAVAITTNEGLSIWIGHKLDALKSEAARPELIGLSRRLMRLPGSRMILAESPLQEETEVFLEGRSSLHEAEGYYLIKSDGTTLASENPEERGLRNRIYDYRPVLMERAFQGETLFIPPIPGREKESMFFVTPVFDASGRVLAVLAVEEDPAKEFTRYCRLGQLGKSGETFAFDDMGVLLSRSRFEEELVRTGLLEPGRSSALNIQLREPQVGGEGPFTLMAASALSGLSGSSTSGYRDYRGKRVYGAWIWNEDLNFAIATEMDEDEAMSSYTRMKNLIYTVLGIILVTATGATLFSITVGERANRSLAAANNSLEERVQKRTKEVREANRNLSNTIEALTHPFYVVDADNYKIVLANSAAKSLSTDGSVTTCHHLTHRNSQPCSCEEHPCPIPLIKEKGEPVVLEHLHFDEKGEPVYVEVYGYPIFDDRGRVVQVIEYSIDITARKNAERDLETARDAAEAATRAKSDFLANMSHEIRTPMNAIIGLSHLIQRTEMTPKQQDYIQKIGGSAQNLLGIINDILDFSKIEAGKLTMESISFDLHEVFENLGSMISPRAQEKNLELVFHVAQDVPGRLKGDPLRLGQILLNLANNAVKFTEAGEIAVSCELIEKTEDHARLKFSVRDTGIGLTEEQQGSLFQAFTQADNSTTRKYGGTGLGLSISKRLSELMGGEIGVESVRGEGSTFFFTARLKTAGEVKKLVVPEEMHNLNVLIVDDNSTSQEVLKEYIEGFSFRAAAVDNGLEAIQLIRRRREEGKDSFKLILMDYSMPELNGFQTAEKINEILKAEERPKYILVTGFGRDEIIRGVEKHSFDGFILKPVNQSLLFNTIIECFGQRSSRPKRAFDIDYPRDFDRVRGARILLTEDNLINQEVARELLEGEGFYVDIASNGEESLNMVRQGEYDLTLMDLQMPVMDGIEATRRIRELPGYGDYPILAMTADAMSGVREEVLQAGMNDYITKPIDQSQLWKALARWISPGNRKLPAAYSPEGTESAPFPAIEGVDSVDAMTRVGGNADFYTRLLTGFCEDYDSFAGDLDSILTRGDREEAARYFHSLKGVSANLGALEISGMAADLEKVVKEGGSPDSGPLNKALDTLITAIRGAVSKESIREEIHEIELTVEELMSRLSEAAESLKKRKPKPAQDIISTLMGSELPGELSVKLNEAEGVMKKYRMKEAAALLEEISRSLQQGTV